MVTPDTTSGAQTPQPAPPAQAAHTTQAHRRRPLRRYLLLALLAVVVIGGVGLAIWLQPYQASAAAQVAMRSDGRVTVSDHSDYIAFMPRGHATTGLIFYPGAKVVPEAYAYYMHQIADHGYATFIVKFPVNIAFLGANNADAPIHDNPGVTTWALGGHSLGGVVASGYANAHTQITGLLLYAAYPASDMSHNTRLKVVSISGSDDGLATPQNVDGAKHLLPPTTTYVVVQGGIHSFFGDYGHQAGDGAPGVSRDVARQQIIAASLGLLGAIGAPASAA